MGSGRAGSLLAASLDGAGHAVTVIDQDPIAFQRLPDDFRGKLVTGNAMESDVLTEAGITGADVFVAATSGDNRNILASQIAQVVFEVPRVVTRIKDPARAEIYSKLGLLVDCRTIEGSTMIMDLAGVDPA